MFVIQAKHPAQWERTAPYFFCPRYKAFLQDKIVHRTYNKTRSHKVVSNTVFNKTIQHRSKLQKDGKVGTRGSPGHRTHKVLTKKTFYCGWNPPRGPQMGSLSYMYTNVPRRLSITVSFPEDIVQYRVPNCLPAHTTPSITPQHASRDVRWKTNVPRTQEPTSGWD